MMMHSQKAQRNVTPAQAGVQNLLKALDSGLRRNDGNRQFQAFCETINDVLLRFNTFVTRAFCKMNACLPCHFDQREKSLASKGDISRYRSK